MCGESRIIILPDFYSKELDNYRNIRVYLPCSYGWSPDKRYPVLYMHDGQNLFDASDSFFKASWNVHKTVDKLVSEGKIQEIIVVGIDNNADRASEYCHFASDKQVLGRMGFRKREVTKEARGFLYEEFIIKSLKPHIDAHFRTLKDCENTALMGSSLGGLVSYNIGFRHPEVFSKLGIVSPAFNWAEFDKLLAVEKEPLKIWIDNGEGEAYYVENTKRVVDALIGKGFIPGKDMAYYLVPDAIHNEDSWAKRLRLPLLFLFGSIGKPVSCKLTGRCLIGLQGMEVTVNPIVHYDSGFIMTDANGRFTVENPNMMDIEPNGRVIPKSCGTTRVTYEKNGLTDTCEFNVIEELSETVRVEFQIKVPSDTSPHEKVYVSIGVMLEAKKDLDGVYKCEIAAPRDWGYHYSIFMGDAYRGEVDKNGQPVRSAIFKATENMIIKHNVESWAAPR